MDMFERYEARTPPSLPTSYVYLIGWPGRDLVKIGVSTNLKQRLQQLRYQHHAQLVILWHTEGVLELERQLQRKFRARHAYGEWFRFPEGDAVELVSEAVSARLSDDNWACPIDINDIDEHQQAVIAATQQWQRIQAMADEARLGLDAAFAAAIDNGHTPDLLEDLLGIAPDVDRGKIPKACTIRTRFRATKRASER